MNLLDTISSYHIPIPPEFKLIDIGDFRKAYSGLTTIGTVFLSSWTALIKKIKEIFTSQKSVKVEKNEHN
jgi:hypothetical protein